MSVAPDIQAAYDAGAAGEDDSSIKDVAKVAGAIPVAGWVMAALASWGLNFNQPPTQAQASGMLADVRAKPALAAQHDRESFAQWQKLVSDAPHAGRLYPTKMAEAQLYADRMLGAHWWAFLLGIVGAPVDDVLVDPAWYADVAAKRVALPASLAPGPRSAQPSASAGPAPVPSVAPASARIIAAAAPAASRPTPPRFAPTPPTAAPTPLLTPARVAVGALVFGGLAALILTSKKKDR